MVIRMRYNQNVAAVKAPICDACWEGRHSACEGGICDCQWTHDWDSQSSSKNPYEKLAKETES